MEKQGDLIFLKYDSAILGDILPAKLLLSFCSFRDGEASFLQKMHTNAKIRSLASYMSR